MIVIGVSYRKITKNLASVPKDIHFYITMMKLAVNLMQEGSIKYRHFGTNYTKKRRVGMFVQHVNGLLKAINQKKKDISCPYCD